MPKIIWDACNPLGKREPKPVPVADPPMVRVMKGPYDWANEFDGGVR